MWSELISQHIRTYIDAYFLMTNPVRPGTPFKAVNIYSSWPAAQPVRRRSYTFFFF